MKEKAVPLLEMGLCDRCLGRFFSDWLHGIDNPERGRRIRAELGAEGGKESCFLCGDNFLDMDKKAEWIADALKGVEYNSFLIGSRFEKETLQREEEIRQSLSLNGESIKVEFNRELGKVFEKMSGKSFAREIPDVEILYDTRYDDIKLQVNPVFIYGRYRKLVRGIPQTRWPCRHCHGKGCEHCNYTGKMYPESVEEIIAAPFMESSAAEEHALHGMGREDIDALMLGTGRPFVLELKNPRRRAFDMDSMESAINSSGKVEVEGLRYSSKAEVRRIKASRAEKTYVVKVEIDPDVDEEKLKNALEMLRTNIKQRTPQRVAHRRADLVRERRVMQIRLLEKEGPVASIEVRGEAGLYIKELMHGDDGRTEPSLASVLGTGCRVLELDVIAIQEKEE